MATTLPDPVPPSHVVIELPRDQYAHPAAPTEWWWHIGTLRSGERVFGFEINIAKLVDSGGKSFGLLQIMLLDVENGVHYQHSSKLPFFKEWAEADPAQPFYARLGTPELDDNWAWMTAPSDDPLGAIALKAQLTDATSGTRILFDLTMSQQGRPLFVWGTGTTAPAGVPVDVTKYNYYYSLTQIECTGAVALGDEALEVSGTTWMDHEYGLFGTGSKPVQWFLQALQLDSGHSISHSVVFEGAPPKAGVPTPSMATILAPDGTTYFVYDCTLTPGDQTWTSSKGQVFFLDFTISIPDFDAELTVTSLIPDQDFPGDDFDVYEGVASATGTFLGQQVTGTAWNEQEP